MQRLSICIVACGVLLLVQLESFFSFPIKAPPFQSQFLRVPSPDSAKSHLHYYASKPHIAGSVGDYETAQYTKRKMQEYGIPEVKLEEFDVVLSYPEERLVEMTSPTRFVASLKEPSIDEDPTSADNTSVPTFNGYSPSGNVTAEVVYANYGRYEDFQWLEEQKISVKGKIVLVRYGHIYRGTKVMIAESKGAVGVLIYSDPKDDGFVRGSVYPDGPWRPKDSVQRGSVQFLSVCPGDPKTRAEKCLSPEDRANRKEGDYKGLLPSIPVQPLSYGDAEPILRNLQSRPVPQDWQGGLDFTYQIGPGPAVVHLQTKMNFSVVPIWNVIGKIPGEQEPDRSIILGNHRDAWVMGAVDPSSGSSALLEVTKGFGKLLKMGWKPRRTIILASWDAEEYGLVGSTWYGENNKETLQEQGIAYLNVDTTESIHFYAQASPSLSSLIRFVTTQVPMPQPTPPPPSVPLSSNWNGIVEALGSGSDYTVFVDHLGIASTNMGFDRDATNYGQYHSIYDSYHLMDKFMDPTYEYHVAVAQLWGVMAMTLSDSAILPFDHVEYGKQLSLNLASIRDPSSDTQIDYSELEAAIEEFQKAAKNVSDEVDQMNLATISSQELRQLNERLAKVERRFLYEKGLPKRPWFQSLIQAPGLYQGYGSDVYPAIAQAIRDKDWATAKDYVQITATAIRNAAQFLAGPPPVTTEPPAPAPESHSKAVLAVLLAIELPLFVIIVSAIVFYMYRSRSATGTANKTSAYSSLQMEELES